MRFSIKQSLLIKPVILSVALMTSLVGLSACGGDDLQVDENVDRDSDRPNVVATSTIIADLTAQIGGDEIELTGILEPGADPHVYEPVPQDTIAFENADLILYNGYNLEPALVKMAHATGVDAAKVAVAEGITPLSFQENGANVPDPHVWGSVENAIAMTDEIRDSLIALSPDDQVIFSRNAEQLTTELNQLLLWITDQVATIPEGQRNLVTTHDAFAYYADAYALEVVGTLIGISTEEQPSAQTVQSLVEAVRSVGVRTLFAETTINPQLLGTVAEEAGVKLAERELYSDSIGAPGSPGDSYINMMVSNTETIVNNLGGEATPWSEVGE